MLEPRRNSWEENSLGIIRKSILIDEKGKIKRIYNTVKPATHTQDIIDEND